MQRPRFLGLLLILVTPALTALDIDSISLQFNESWTGNAFVESWTGYSVTGSEPVPVTAALGAGVRLNLISGVFGESDAMVLEPSLYLSRSEVLLFQSGRVVPTQIETGLGDENGLPGDGSTRLLTLQLVVPASYELTVNRLTFGLGFSPTFLFRIRTRPITIRTDTNGDPVSIAEAGRFYYRLGRFVMPEVDFSFSYRMSELTSIGFRARSLFPIFHLWDGEALPFWDQMQLGVAVELRFSLPISRLWNREPPDSSLRDVPVE